MADHDVVVRDAHVVTSAGLAIGDIAIRDGVVTHVGPSIPGAAREEILASGLHALPGVIDVHVHFNEPGRSDWEGIATGSAALAVGGGTMFVDMPLNSHPPLLEPGAFDAKRAAAERSSHTDFALWGGLTPSSLPHLGALAARGVAGFKAFLCDSGIAEFQRADDATLHEGMRIAAALGLPVLVHAENDALTRGRSGMARPAIAEREAIERTLLFAQDTGCRVHIVHVSIAEGVDAVASAAARGVDVSCETCPHYLVLSVADVARLGAHAKCAPPVRPSEHDALWERVADGRVPIVASDHSPCPPAMKDDVPPPDAWGGVSGCQSTLGLMLEYGHARRGIPIGHIVAALATNAAARFGFSSKGEIRAGADADIALVDVSHAANLRREDLRYRHRQSAHIGTTHRGRVARVMLRGRTVVRDGAVVGPPRGRLVTPATMSAT